MTCKCTAQTYAAHLRKTAAGYPAHAYRGAVWNPETEYAAAPGPEGREPHRPAAPRS
ncbi:hypothetical protein SMD44_p10047 (plasmid) [Streptomyces alboflavus]|uniref:Uncharacterized protein n=1 Tax=Streptomyces alboflavus TaxID=67267 RepID=A0A291W4G6_9ACTN|nr:hypothetical protein SMD44_p10047 [Streptomyces alboflavus]